MEIISTLEFCTCLSNNCNNFSVELDRFPNAAATFLSVLRPEQTLISLLCCITASETSRSLRGLAQGRVVNPKKGKPHYLHPAVSVDEFAVGISIDG